jgi:surface antigen
MCCRALHSFADLVGGLPGGSYRNRHGPRPAGKPVGTTAKWSNPESQNSGKIALVRKFTRNGQQCETLDYRLITKRRPVGPQHYRLSSCLQPDGQWRLL